MTNAPSGTPVRQYGVDNANYSGSANPIPVTTGGLTAANITTTTTAIPSSAATVTLVAAASSIVISNLSPSATLYVRFDGVAPTAGTGSQAGIAPGAAYVYQGVPLSSFKVIGSAASGNYSVFAN